MIETMSDDGYPLETRNLDLYYGAFQALKQVDFRAPARAITAIIGPSGCGKSTLVRVFNRMNDTIAGTRVEGTVLVNGRDVYAPGVDLIALRKKAGMVFQRPNPFPLSVFDNIAYGPRVHGHADRAALEAKVRSSLESVGLWEEMKDRLHRDALALTPEQQQRLCIARLMAVESEILLMDEPCSALDPYSTARIEELMRELSGSYTIAIVTHNMEQAARISDRTAFMLLGEMVECDETQAIFENPADPRTEEYVTGRYG
jgi:phosphate transport system ATP-binding protein